MHIPDNYLSPATCAAMGAIMVPALAVSMKKVRKEMTRERLPLLGVGAALSFLIMMFNVPVAGGTTCHAIGGTLIAIILGPYAACVSISVALLLQAVLFGDGGILALGANCFNMAFVMPFAGYFIYTFIKQRLGWEKGDSIAAAVASYLGINLAALFAAIEFGIQPLFFKGSNGLPLYCPYPLSVSIPAMLIPHLTVAGVIEVIVTLGVLGFIKKAAPDIFNDVKVKKTGPVYGLIAVLIFISPIGLIASGTAWGEWDAKEIHSNYVNGKALGYVPNGIKNGFRFSGIFNDYSVKGLPSGFGYVLSAVAGVAILIITFRIIASFSKKNKA